MLRVLQKKIQSLVRYLFIKIVILKVNVFLKKSRIHAPKDIMQFGAKFFVSSTDSRHLGEMKIVPMMKTNGHQGTLQFF